MPSYYWHRDPDRAEGHTTVSLKRTSPIRVFRASGPGENTVLLDIGTVTIHATPETCKALAATLHAAAHATRSAAAQMPGRDLLQCPSCMQRLGHLYGRPNEPLVCDECYGARRAEPVTPRETSRAVTP